VALTWEEEGRVRGKGTALGGAFFDKRIMLMLAVPEYEGKVKVQIEQKPAFSAASGYGA
jgi:hypothetical protein